jgi:hypothetical protein
MILMGKTYAGKAEGGSVGYAEGGEVKADEPSQDEMLAHVMLNKVASLRDVTSLKDVGANEAPNLKVKEYVAPGMGQGLPIGGVDFQPEMPGHQMLPEQPNAPMGAMPPQPGQPAGQMPPTGQPQGQPPAPTAPGAPRSNILQMTPQGQAMAAMRPNQPMPRMAGGGSTTPSVEEMRRAIASAATSAGMKAPVTANKALTGVNDFHQSLGDAVRERATNMQNTMESMPYKYNVGDHVFTEDSARKNWPPMRILAKRLSGNKTVRENPKDVLSKTVRDPVTGKAKRTPHEPG